MPIFTVHVPRYAAEPLASAERIRFVPDGFAWGAFVFGPLWALWNRLWLALVLWIAAAAFIGFLSLIGFHWLSVFGLALLIEYFFGLEGNGLLAAALHRRGFILGDVVVAAGRDAAERAYFQRRMQARPAAGPAGPRADGGETEEFVGLSPDPGG